MSILESSFSSNGIGGSDESLQGAGVRGVARQGRVLFIVWSWFVHLFVGVNGIRIFFQFCNEKFFCSNPECFLFIADK